MKFQDVLVSLLHFIDDWVCLFVIVDLNYCLFRPGSAPSARPMPKPVPAVGITGVLHAIGSEPPHPEPLKTPPGIGMTGALQAIGAKEDSPEERPKYVDKSNIIVLYLNICNCR